ncbi:hypothetical protein EXIGLDRAFT_573704, partial [Exidia glandulosa HHB12029]
LPHMEDDVLLHGIYISHLEHADDVLLVATTPEGLQIKIDLFYRWCRENLMVINALKTHICIHGPRPRLQPQFSVSDAPIAVVTEYVYLGVKFQSDARNLFKSHYEEKAAKARRAAHGVLHIESMIGSLPPWEGRILYMGRVDPHLIQGCEISPDVDDDLFEELYSVQKAFIRRILGVHKRSPVAPLHTESGLVPLKFRRLELALRFLDYLRLWPRSSYASAAYHDAVELSKTGHKGWLMDIVYVAQALGLKLQLRDLWDLDAKGVELLQWRLQHGLKSTLDEAIATGHKTYLLRGRLEPQSNGTLKHETICLRHYLHVPTLAHRRSLTRILFGCHLLAVERLAWSERYRREVPHDERLCRFCRRAVESPEHAMFRCVDSPELLVARTKYLASIYTTRPEIRRAAAYQDAAEYLRLLISDKETISLTAAFAHEVLK